ncbi:MCM2/3/5 family-domain-containing protein [Chytridium lagenaria]|nr:MCM2/3/5 family-domain-containing protein [Chytridium lagenaria]
MLKRPTPQPPSTQRQPKRIKPHCPYPDWSLYFQEGKASRSPHIILNPVVILEYRDNHDLIPLIKAAKEYFSKYSTKDQDLNGDIILLNYQHLKRFCGFDGLVEDLVTRPQTFFNSIALAAVAALAEENWEAHLVKRKKSVRLLEYDVITPLKALKANLIGRFISVKGTIVRVSSIKPMITRMVFQCQTCQRQFEEELADGKHSAPKRCVIISCRGKMFQPILSGNGTVAVDWQRIRIQEKLADDQFDSGRIPRTVECEMMDDLVDNVVPGTCKMKSSKTTSMYSLYISANSLIKASAKSADVGEGSEEADAPLQKILCSFQERISGILLTLFGGRNRSSDDNKSLTIRSNPHVLIVGDPGLGKSQMLSATTKVAPRGVYVCGNTATTSGLTVTICKDGDTGDTALEAGALVLGDKGVCCIDEFDKITEYHALLEAMEQQASVIAAATPKAKTVSENLKMNSALLSRFDLIFILLDKPNENMDLFLSEHIVKGRSFREIEVGGWEEFDRLTPEAAVALQEFYLNLRKCDPSFRRWKPHHHAQLESLIRLSEARARSELRQKVTKEDAEDVIFIMKSCLWGTFENEFGDYSFLWKGTGMSRKGDPKRFIAGLSQRAEQSGCSQFTYNELLTIAKDNFLISCNMPLQAVHVCSQVFFLLTTYALSTEKEETLAMLMGRFENLPSGVIGIVERSHSHPHITVFPSAVDLRCQSDQQMLGEHFFGLIVSCFDEKNLSQRLQLTCFQALPNADGILTRVEVPVLVRPSETGLSLENLRQYVRIPEIFLNEERELFQSVTNIEGDTLAERKLVESYHSGPYVRALVSLLDKLCIPMTQMCEEKTERNKKEIQRLRSLIQENSNSSSMSWIDEHLIRKRAEHNDGELSTLREVTLHQFDIEKIENLDVYCRNLEILFLQNNLISRIENVGKLKSLKYLNLALNNIKVIENLEGCESLEKLDLTVNFVANPLDIERLQANTFLRELYLVGNPVTSVENYRPFTIWTLKQLKSLDGREIEKSERIEAGQIYEKRSQKFRVEETLKEESAESLEQLKQDFNTKLTPYTPESRMETAKHIQKFKGTESIPAPEPPAPEMPGPDEDAKTLTLHVSLSKYLDSSYIKVDTHPTYIRLEIKGKVLQLVLDAEVDTAMCGCGVEVEELVAERKKKGTEEEKRKAVKKIEMLGGKNRGVERLLGGLDDVGIREARIVACDVGREENFVDDPSVPPLC